MENGIFEDGYLSLRPSKPLLFHLPLATSDYGIVDTGPVLLLDGRDHGFLEIEGEGASGDGFRLYHGPLVGTKHAEGATGGVVSDELGGTPLEWGEDSEFWRRFWKQSDPRIMPHSLCPP